MCTLTRNYISIISFYTFVIYKLGNYNKNRGTNYNHHHNHHGFLCFRQVNLEKINFIFLFSRQKCVDIRKIYIYVLTLLLSSITYSIFGVYNNNHRTNNNQRGTDNNYSWPTTILVPVKSRYQTRKLRGPSSDMSQRRRGACRDTNSSDIGRHHTKLHGR